MGIRGSILTKQAINYLLDFAKLCVEEFGTLAPILIVKFSNHEKLAMVKICSGENPLEQMEFLAGIGQKFRDEGKDIAEAVIVEEGRSSISPNQGPPTPDWVA